MPHLSARPRLAARFLACTLLAAPAIAQRQPTGIADFMVMTVCTDAADAIVPGVAPTDTACTHPRKIRNAEVPSYRLTDFAAATGPCLDQQGIVARVNVPVTIGDATRVISFDSHVRRGGCSLSGDGTVAGVSIQGNDGLWGFIMGDAGPTGTVNFDSPS